MANNTVINKLWNRNFIAVLVANCLVSISFFLVNPTFPVYIKSIVNDLGIVGLLSAILLISGTLGRPLSSVLMERFSNSKVLIAGLFLLVLSISSYIYIRSIPGIIAVRVVHGIGMSLATTAFGTVASENIPASRMGEGIGYFGLGLVLGMSVGPALGLSLLNAFNAQVVFGVAAAFSLLGGLLFLFAYQSKTSSNVSVRHLKRVTSVRVSTFFERKALVPAGIVFFLGIIVAAVTTYLALYSRERGIVNIGFFYTVQALSILVTRPINGKLADKKGYAYVIIPSIFVLGVCMVLLYFATAPWMFVVIGLLHGFGYGSLSSSCQALAVIRSAPERRGVAISTFYLGMDAGNGLGTILTGVLSGAFGYAMMYLLCVVPLVFGLGVYVLGDRKATKPSV